jgi:hypothetical protein
MTVSLPALSGAKLQRVELVHAEKGARKLSCTMALQTHCGLSPAQAKKVADAMLARQYPEVSLPSAASARSLIVALAGIGVVARFAEGPDYNPAERLALALESVQAKLKPAVLLTCQSLSAHGEWELALSHCLAHLPMREDAGSSPEFVALSELAVEFGILQSGGS